MSSRQLHRRHFLQMMGAASCNSLLPRWTWAEAAKAVVSDARRMVRFPQKSELILVTDRPPLLETPLHYFRQDLTPNEAYFVR